jgi:branched-chain amino acid transport system substrate-binding protein
MKRVRWQRLVTVGTVAAMFGSGIGLTIGSAGPAGASAAKSPLTIALIVSETGQAASQFADGPIGFRARVAQQNAQGGIDGHKIVPLVIDDQTNPTTVVTAVQQAISKGAIGIVSDSPLFFAAAKYPHQAGIPVTGGTFDGPEWGTQPYTNMFASDTGSINPKYPVSTLGGDFLKSKGGTVLGSYGYGISPSSARSAVGTAKSFEHAGGKTGVLNTSIPFGGVDFTTESLVAKSKKVNALYAGMDNNSNFALATSLKQAGVKLKVVTFPTGYEPDVINSPAWSVVQGFYFETTFRPTAIPNAGTVQFAKALQKYQGRPPAQFPTFNIYESWLGADLMIKGLQLAGPNPTSAAVIKALRGVKSYNGNGLLPVSTNYTTNFGHDLPKACAWFMQAQTKGFVPVSTTPTCGTDIPGTQTASP